MMNIYNFTPLLISDLEEKGYIVETISDNYVKLSKESGPEYIMAFCEKDSEGRDRVTDFTHFYGLDAVVILRALYEDFDYLRLVDEYYVVEHRILRKEQGQVEGQEQDLYWIIPQALFDRTRTDICGEIFS